jgi:hypothetical protein
MEQERKMIRKAADNKYLHKDFHNIMNIGLNYVEKKYGAEAVKEYLRQFALAYYIPLKKRMQKNGLYGIETHIRDIYEKEEWTNHIFFRRSENRLMVKIDKCPAVFHIKKSGGRVSRLYRETTKTIYDAICEDTPVDFELMNYDDNDGKAELVFYIDKERV